MRNTSATSSDGSCPSDPADASSPTKRLASTVPANFVSPRRRAGLTLTELLVVVSIIAMILALLTPTLMGARRTAMNAKVKAEIDLLHIALMNYKNEYGAFPPANMAGLWTGSQVNQQHPVYRHLVRAFPRIKEPPAAYQLLSQLSPAQALVFWLRGFYENPEFPLTNDDAQGQRRKLFDFDESRLYGVVYGVAGAYVPGGSAPQSFVARKDLNPDSFGHKYPVYFTGLPRSGLPYVYFDSRCYDQPGFAGYPATTMGGGNDSKAQPYFTSDPPQKALWSQRHVNPDTFQLIAAGLDGDYGVRLDDQLRAAYPYDVELPPNNIVVSAAKLPAHADNITNFAPNPLGEAIRRLTAE